MFTGLIECTGLVVSIETTSTPNQISAKLSISEHLCSEAKQGDSIAINGCCLTVSDLTDNRILSFDISQETLNCTGLGSLSKGDKVNMERSMQLSSRLDGHIVSGHIDGKATVCLLEKCHDYWRIGVSIPSSQAANIIDKGSICIDGVSLTINKIIDNKNSTTIELMLIPTTIAKTNLAQLEIDKVVNVEYDLVGKYIRRQAQLSL
ncbi:MAG: riboflavin synthase [Oligoflexales bacterium]